jgi:hypothetical protein
MDYYDPENIKTLYGHLPYSGCGYVHCGIRDLSVEKKENASVTPDGIKRRYSFFRGVQKNKQFPDGYEYGKSVLPDR